MSTDARLFFPATERNREPIAAVLEGLLDSSVTRVLELASGSGEHLATFAPRFPRVLWQPSDPDAGHRASIDAWRSHVAAPNLLPALALDVLTGAWPDGPWDIVLATNLVHVAPPELPAALFRGAARVLAPAGRVVTYGPYRVGGAHTSASNEAFDAHLKKEDPRWGVRDVAELEAAATGFVLEARVPMPANNFMLVFRLR